VDYHFLTEEEFSQRRERGEMLECIEVFGGGNWYGTLREEVTSSLAAGKWVILEIDVDGTQAVLEQYPQAITIFICPDSMEELERRLRGRGTETAPTIERRLEVARRELGFADQYAYRVTNDSVDRAVQQIEDILERLERSKADAQPCPDSDGRVTFDDR